jgi:hypothetical protein
MDPTPYPDLNAVLQELVTSIQAILGPAFVAAYLQGSFGVGDFDRHSDVDFTIAIEDELSAAQLQALQAMHERIYNLECKWAQHLEGSYFPRAVLKDCAQAGKLLWYLDNGSRALVQSNHCNTVVVRWTVRERGIPLAGPAPTALIDPILVNTLRGDILTTINDWGQQILDHPEPYQNRFYQSFIVLSYCRMLHDLGAGSIGSKRTGADWAKANLAERWTGLIDRSWDGRPDPAVSVRQPADPQDFALTLEFVRYIIGLANAVSNPDGEAFLTSTID